MKTIVRRDTGEDWKEYVTRRLRRTSIAGWKSAASRIYEARRTRGRPSIPPGVYFRMPLIGYCEVAEYDDHHRTIKYTHPGSQPDDTLHATN